MTTYIFRARGTGEPYGDNTMLGHVTNIVRRSHPNAVIEDVRHSASISLAGGKEILSPSGDNSATQIVTRLNLRISQLQAGDAFIVIGYSLGSVGVTRWYQQYTPTVGGPVCLMVGNIANPSRHETTSYGMPYTSGASGIYATQGTRTTRATINSPTPFIEIANPGDVMTTCHAASPLHAFAGPVMAFSFANPTDLIADLQRGGIEEIVSNVANIRNWFNPKWWTWPGDLHAYMTHSHTTDYGLPLWRDSAGKPVSGIELLARQINWRIGRSVNPLPRAS